MRIESQEYEDLRHTIEEATGRKIQTPKDFEYLALRIYDRTHMQLSVSTLKRFWGYVAKEDAGRGEMRLSTLNILADYIGYTNWEAFINREQAEGIDSSSAFYGQRALLSKDIPVGDLVQVMWKPNRCVTLRYSGNNVFMVTESLHSKLSAGDTFLCPLFIEHKPLNLINLVHEGGSPCSYVCGKVGGIVLHYPIS